MRKSLQVGKTKRLQMAIEGETLSHMDLGEELFKFLASAFFPS